MPTLAPTPPPSLRAPSAVSTADAADTAPETPSRRGMRWAWVLGAAVVSLVLTVQHWRDPDAWWHLALGDLIRRSGIPHTEPFTFLGAPNTWVGQQWGYELLLSLTVAAGGVGLAMVVMGLIASGALVAAVRSVPRSVRVPGPFLAGGLVLSALVAATVLGVRGQVITVLGSALVLLVLARWRDGSTRALFALPPLLLVWANLHAGFVNGIGLCAVVLVTVAVWRRVQPGAVAGASLRALLVATVVSFLATLVNPAGPHLYSYILSTFTNPTLTEGITEWMSPNFHDWWLRLFEAEALLLVLLWTLSRRPDPVDVVLGIGAVAMTLQAQRNVSLFAIIAAPQVARYGFLAWSSWRGPRRAAGVQRPAGPALLLVAVLAVAVSVAYVVPVTRPSSTERSEATRFPKAAADYVAAHLAGQRLYSTYEWGGYLVHRFPTQHVVYIYGESAIFGAQRLERYLDIHLVRADWRFVLDEDGMHAAVVPADSQEATAFLEAGWLTLCHDADSNAVVMQDTGATPAENSPPPPDPAAAPACDVPAAVGQNS